MLEHKAITSQRVQERLFLVLLGSAAAKAICWLGNVAKESGSADCLDAEKLYGDGVDTS